MYCIRFLSVARPSELWYLLWLSDCDYLFICFFCLFFFFFLLILKSGGKQQEWYCWAEGVNFSPLTYSFFHENTFYLRQVYILE